MTEEGCVPVLSPFSKPTVLGCSCLAQTLSTRSVFLLSFLVWLCRVPIVKLTLQRVSALSLATIKAPMKFFPFQFCPSSAPWGPRQNKQRSLGFRCTHASTLSFCGLYSLPSPWNPLSNLTILLLLFYYDSALTLLVV